MSFYLGLLERSEFLVRRHLVRHNYTLTTGAAHNYDLVSQGL
jgi:hypothetical protein